MKRRFVEKLDSFAVPWKLVFNNLQSVFLLQIKQKKVYDRPFALEMIKATDEVAF